MNELEEYKRALQKDAADLHNQNRDMWEFETAKMKDRLAHNFWNKLSAEEKYFLMNNGVEKADLKQWIEEVINPE
jgi:hypothetical protein